MNQITSLHSLRHSWDKAFYDTRQGKWNKGWTRYWWWYKGNPHVKKMVPQKTKSYVRTWQGRQYQKTQMQLYQRNCSCIKIKSYSGMNPINLSSCRILWFFRWKKAAVDISVNRFYFITDELKMLLQFFSLCYSFIDIFIFWHVHSPLSCLKFILSWETKQQSAIFPFVWQPFTFAILWRTPSLMFKLLILFRWSLTFWVASSVRPTKRPLLNLYFFEWRSLICHCHKAQ